MQNIFVSNHLHCILIQRLNNACQSQVSEFMLRAAMKYSDWSMCAFKLKNQCVYNQIEISQESWKLCCCFFCFCYLYDFFFKWGTFQHSSFLNVNICCFSCELFKWFLGIGYIIEDLTVTWTKLWRCHFQLWVTVTWVIFLNWILLLLTLTILMGKKKKPFSKGLFTASHNLIAQWSGKTGLQNALPV